MPVSATVQVVMSGLHVIVISMPGYCWSVVIVMGSVVVRRGSIGRCPVHYSWLYVSITIVMAIETVAAMMNMTVPVTVMVVIGGSR